MDGVRESFLSNFYSSEKQVDLFAQSTLNELSATIHNVSKGSQQAVLQVAKTFKKTDPCIEKTEHNLQAMKSSLKEYNESLIRLETSFKDIQSLLSIMEVFCSRTQQINKDITEGKDKNIL